MNTNWKNEYPYTLDKPLKEALDIAFKESDFVMARQITELLVFYRKSENFEKCQELQRKQS